MSEGYMEIQKKLRDMQDHARNARWRIQWIPWQESGKPEYVFNTPVTLITGFGGAALFIGAIGYIVFQIYGSDSSMTISPQTIKIVLAVGVAGLVIIFLGRIYAAFRKQAGWKRITARCIDREIRECYGYSDGMEEISWEYRLVCTFNYHGKEYKVTPELSHTVSFNSEKRVHEYLSEKIRPDGSCQIWIDPRNPLHAIFDKKQWI